MKLICHIGSPKTASTLIQNSFAANETWLQRHGIAYGRILAPDPNHITLFFICARELHDFARDYGLHSQEDVVAFRKRLSRQIEQHKSRLPEHVHTMVMSSENLMGNLRHPDEITHLRRFLEARFEDIKIVVYVRRQDDAILSMYGEFMRRGFSPESFDEFVNICLAPGTPTPYLYYRRELSQWINVWGKDRIIVRRFSPVDFINNDILSDFMGIVQNSWEPDMQGFVPSSDDNRGLSAPALEFLRRLHSHVPFMKAGQPNLKRTRLTPFINALPQRPRPIMAAETAHHIMTHFRPANKWLKEEFFPDLDGAFFPNRPDHPEHGNLGQLSTDQSMALSGQLLFNLLGAVQ